MTAPTVDRYAAGDPWPRRLGRGLWRAARALLVTWVAITVVSVGFNLATTPPDTLRPTTGADVELDDVTVHYEQWGSSGPPIVLVHGFAESSVSWGPMAELLGTDHVVYAIDLAGAGYTTRTGKYTLDDQVELVTGFINSLGLNRPVLVGHSLGAAVVGGVALKHPDAIRGVIFADGDALPFQRGSSPAEGQALIVRLPYVTSLYRIATRSTWLGDQLIRRQCGPRCAGLTPELTEAWLRPFRQHAAERALPAQVRVGLLALTPEQLRSITVPRAIIWGADDPTSGGSLAATRTNLGNPPEVIIPKAGHLSMVSDPAAFAEAVRSLSKGF